MNADLALVAEGIHKSFGDLTVLRGVSLEARQGDVISMIGASGSGKSTFLRCLNFLETPDQGRVVVDGEEVEVHRDGSGRPTGANPRQVQHLRTKLGMVFQSFNLWAHMTVLQNVMEGPVQVLKRPAAEAREEALEILGKVGIAEKHASYPAQLSGGQQQRVAIARALTGGRLVRRVSVWLMTGAWSRGCARFRSASARCSAASRGTPEKPA